MARQCSGSRVEHLSNPQREGNFLFASSSPPMSMFRGTSSLLMRSIRGDAQRREPHAIRLGAVLFILALLVGAHLQGPKVGAPGLLFFKSLSMLGVALVTLAAIGHFSTSITEEKEQGTLSLLLLADISPLAILLGKSTNRVLSAWMVFVAQFPFALLSLTLGGLTVQQIGAAYLALAAYLFFMANLALLVSVMVNGTGEAVAVMFLLTLLLFGIPSWQHDVAAQLLRSGWIGSRSLMRDLSGIVDQLAEQTSVVSAINRIFDFDQQQRLFTWQLVLSLLFGCLFFALAWMRFRRIVWAADGVEPRRLQMPKSNSRWISLVSRPWRWAMAWKDFHFITGGPLMLAMKIVFIPLFVALCFLFRREVEMISGMRMPLFVQNCLLIIFTVELLAYCSQLLHVEVKGGTLSTLMMIPQSPVRIVYGKLAGCLLGLLPTFLFMLLAFQFLKQNAGLAERNYFPLAPSERFLLLGDISMVSSGCALLILCQLTVLCSLLVRWGALPLAIAMMLMTGAVVLPMLSGTLALVRTQYSDSFTQLSPVLYTTAMISLALHFEIGRRMQQVAGR